MELHRIAVVLLVLCHIQLFGQTKLNGILIDAQTNLPVEYATIYIHGTTIGTLSDTTGNFQLKNIKIPCQLVVSHIGYKTYSVTLQNSLPHLLNLSLTPREIIVDEVKVSDKNLRGKNILTFKKYFLGTDVWGKYAKIENEDAIIFSKDYETKYLTIENKQLPYFIEKLITDLRWNEDSTIVAYRTATNLKANSHEPLIINLPLLGYNLYVNLVSFILSYNTSFYSDHSSILGFYYFQPIKPESKRDSIRIDKNRSKAFYNSTFHFCRSLYENNLEKNGYRVFENVADKPYYKKQFKEFKLDSFLHIHGNVAEIIGLKGRHFFIFYYHHANGRPIDLTQKIGISPVQTELFFLNDTCVIRNDGTTPGNSLAFGPYMGSKKIGAMLPDNYVPPNK
jgi:hypothetical protein